MPKTTQLASSWAAVTSRVDSAPVSLSMIFIVVASGTISAESESDAVGELRRQGMTVMSMSQKRGGAKEDGKPGFFSLQVGGGAVTADRAKVKDAEMVVFTRQLATMISSGITLLESLEILIDQAESPPFRATLRAITVRRAGLRR